MGTKGRSRLPSYIHTCMYVKNVSRYRHVRQSVDKIIMARRKKEDALETRHRILDTAARVFLKKGTARTSLDDIAAAAGVTRGAIYWHFKNKIDLFDAMAQ